jgi:hypothetical protein
MKAQRLNDTQDLRDTQVAHMKAFGDATIIGVVFLGQASNSSFVMGHSAILGSDRIPVNSSK